MIATSYHIFTQLRITKKKDNFLWLYCNFLLWELDLSLYYWNNFEIHFLINQWYLMILNKIIVNKYIFFYLYYFFYFSLQTGMRGAFGKPQGTVARVNIGQPIISVRSLDKHKHHVVEALRRAKFKFPGRQKVCYLS